MEQTDGKPKTKGKATPGTNSQVEEALNKVYKDGFNIYMMLNRVKKDIGRTENFPDEVILSFCEHYWRYKPAAKYPYFLKAFKMVSGQWHADNQIKRNKEYKTQGIPQSIKDIMKGMAK